MSVAIRFLGIDGRESHSDAVIIRGIIAAAIETAQQFFHFAATFLNLSAVRGSAPQLANQRKVSATTVIRRLLQHPTRSRPAESSGSSALAIRDLAAARRYATADQVATVATVLVKAVGAGTGQSTKTNSGDNHDC